ncbi:MAG: phage terminase large subunit [Thermomicrobiales bacterium]
MATVMQRTSAALSLADDLAAALDPVVFARAAGVEPDGWQANVLRSRHKRMLLNCSRQSGKSTTTALVALHRAIYVPGSLVLLLSPSLRQSSELFRKVSQSYAALGASVPSTSETVLRLELENGSRILSLPATESTIRGYSAVDLLVIDEAARVSSELIASVRPMLAVSNGRLVTLSTPWGSRGWWYEAWRSQDDWERVEVPATMCPRISPAFLAEERRNMGQWWFDQEFLCQFLDAESAAFRSEDIEAAFDKGMETWAL